jgi:SAM-dependent methyltransferase
MNISVQFWNMLANNFNEQEGRYKNAHIKTVECTKKYINAADLILDYGCATGTTAFEIADQVKRVRAIDFSSKMIAAAKRNAAQQKAQNVDFVQATIFDSGLDAGAFDTILAFGILHLLKNLPQVLQRINQLLKPEGWFISSTACVGNDETIPIWINRLLFIPGRIGILPTLQFLEIPKLEHAITCAGFKIVETETIPFELTDTDKQTYITGYFIAAQKVSDNSGEDQ